MPQAVPTHRLPRVGPSRHVQYNRTTRDADARRFYLSTAWKKLRILKLAIRPICEECLTQDRFTEATIVHHVIEIGDDPSRRLDIDNLRSLCRSCHSRLHAPKSV